MRRKVKNRNIPEADRLYNSAKLSKFINCLMWDGRKATAEGIVYKALEIVKEKTANPNPLEVFDLALKNTGPTMEVRSRRIGGANYQVPREVRAERRLALSIRWMLDAARAKKGSNMEVRLADELTMTATLDDLVAGDLLAMRSAAIEFGRHAVPPGIGHGAVGLELGQLRGGQVVG
mgnify:CR=1 FL=1